MIRKIKRYFKNIIVQRRINKLRKDHKDLHIDYYGHCHELGGYFAVGQEIPTNNYNDLFEALNKQACIFLKEWRESKDK